MCPKITNLIKIVSAAGELNIICITNLIYSITHVNPSKPFLKIRRLQAHKNTQKQSKFFYKAHCYFATYPILDKPTKGLL